MKTLALALSLATLVSGSAVSGQTMSREDSLKATHELLLQAVKSANVAMVTNVLHPQAVGFFRASQRLVDLKTVPAASIVPTVLSDLSQFVVTEFETTYRQVGDVGIVAISSKADSKKQPDRFLRTTYVYLFAGDTWKLLSWHSSDTPLKK